MILGILADVGLDSCSLETITTNISFFFLNFESLLNSKAFSFTPISFSTKFTLSVVGTRFLVWDTPVILWILKIFLVVMIFNSLICFVTIFCVFFSARFSSATTTAWIFSTFVVSKALFQRRCSKITVSWFSRSRGFSLTSWTHVSWSSEIASLQLKLAFHQFQRTCCSRATHANVD